MNRVGWIGFIKKYISRKFLLLTALFVMAQYLKYCGTIADWAWLGASAIGTFGWAALELWFRYKNGGKLIPDGEGK